MSKKLEQWVKKHRTCPDFKTTLAEHGSDEEYYENIEEPAYFVYGISLRSPTLCKKVIKQALLNSSKLQADEDTTKHVKKACQVSVPDNTHAWFEQRDSARDRTNLQRAALKFVNWKQKKTSGQFAGAIATLIVRANSDMGVEDAKTKFMAYLKDNVSFEQWSEGLED